MNVITNWFRLLLGNPQLVILVLTLVLGLGAVLWIGNMVAPILASVIIGLPARRRRETRSFASAFPASWGSWSSISGFSPC